MAALLVAGAVSHGVIRHIVQTAPLWLAIVLGVRRSELCKWAALPSFLFWLLLMMAIWLFLLGRARIVSGTFTPVEIAMTIVVGGCPRWASRSACEQEQPRGRPQPLRRRSP